MDPAESHHGVTWNQSTLGLSLHSTTDTLVMTFYLLLVVCVGLWMGISIYSSNIGSGHYMALAGIGAASGIAVGALEWNSIFMLFLLGWIFVPIYSKAEVVTLPEYLKKRFGSLRIQLFFTFIFLIVYIFSRISMEIGFGAMFLKMVWDTDIYQTMLTVLTIIGMYTITGGLATVAYVESLQAGIMILGSALLMGYAFYEVGGYPKLVSKYMEAIPSKTQQGNWTAQPECYLPRQDAFHIFRSCVSGDIPWPGLILGATTVSLFYGCADQVSVQRFLAGKSRLHMEGGCLLCGYLKLLPMFLMVMPGMISRILYPDQVACVVPSECQKFCGRGTGCSALAYPVLVLGVMPHGLQGFMLSTVCASLMSSLTSIFNSSSALFTLNIYTWIRPTATEKELMIAGRFFVIILLAVTIVWIPIIEMAPNEILFEYMQVLKSCLTPSMTAVFLLAVFCKRVNEQGAFWGLIVGTTIGVFRLLAEFFYGPVTCGRDRQCPIFICGLHYLYFGFCLFLVTILIILAISLATEPIPDHHLHGLCWSLRNSQQRRVALDKEMRWKAFPSFTSQPGMFGEAHTCLWKFWDLFCGLDSQSKCKTGPENATEKELEDTWKKVVSSDRSTAFEILARRMAARKSEEHEDRMKDWSNEPESLFWKRVVQASAILLFLILIVAHVYFA
ncbi:solute carrier family 5 (sodium/glucose cotransporter)-like [Mus musculus]|uniref:Predicted gene 5134 n=1 Tax=Mus musculus TaxID=10090 RepID=E9QAB5_MOUSE|nr:solute carrier family 5 (sodium/glucose cotransporter)-like [Mus musculus]|eukprot:NP_941037.2 solute carrier family 5 (sodium/glucose cotransporter)-like [Mus musculus]